MSFFSLLATHVRKIEQWLLTNCRYKALDITQITDDVYMSSNSVIGVMDQKRMKKMFSKPTRMIVDTRMLKEIVATLDEGTTDLYFEEGKPLLFNATDDVFIALAPRREED